jgi:hypothetical protein
MMVLLDRKGFKVHRESQAILDPQDVLDQQALQDQQESQDILDH